jgi:Myb-like DNA-binding domain
VACPPSVLVHRVWSERCPPVRLAGHGCRPSAEASARGPQLRAALATSAANLGSGSLRRGALARPVLRRWSAVAKKIPGRTGQQCAQRWRHKVNPTIRKDKWTPEEDAQLVSLYEVYGNTWAEIARHLDVRHLDRCQSQGPALLLSLKPIRCCLATDLSACACLHGLRASCLAQHLSVYPAHPLPGRSPACRSRRPGAPPLPPWHALSALLCGPARPLSQSQQTDRQTEGWMDWQAGRQADMEGSLRSLGMKRGEATWPKRAPRPCLAACLFTGKWPAGDWQSAQSICLQGNGLRATGNQLRLCVRTRGAGPH